MTKKERVKQILTILDILYPDTVCYLNYQKPHELLIATILSAQCTDERVNMVTPKLFERYPTLFDFASSDLTELSELVRSTGFYRTKAKHIQEASKMLMENFGGELPDSVEELTGLPGVGRKTANVVLTHIFNKPAVVVDTHVGRLSRRIGLSKHKDPEKVEQDLMKLLPKSHWGRINTQLIAHGRAVCTSRKAKCESCALISCCMRMMD